MKELFLRLWRDEAGQDLTEYALLLALVALFAIAATQTLATAIVDTFNAASAAMQAVLPAAPAP